MATEITYYIGPDAFDSVDPQHNDIPASLEAYADAVDEALAAAYPGATIAVEVAFGRGSAWADDDDITEDVDRIANTVYQSNTFWETPRLGE